MYLRTSITPSSTPLSCAWVSNGAAIWSCAPCAHDQANNLHKLSSRFHNPFVGKRLRTLHGAGTAAIALKGLHIPVRGNAPCDTRAGAIIWASRSRRNGACQRENLPCHSTTGHPPAPWLAPGGGRLGKVRVRVVVHGSNRA